MAPLGRPKQPAASAHSAVKAKQNAVPAGPLAALGSRVTPALGRDTLNTVNSRPEKHVIASVVGTAGVAAAPAHAGGSGGGVG